MYQHPQLRQIDNEDQKSTVKRTPPKYSHGIARFNFAHNTPRMKATDIDLVVQSCSDSADLIIVEGKNRDEEFRYFQMLTLSLLASERIKCFIAISTSDESFDVRSDRADDDYSDIILFEIEPITDATRLQTARGLFNVVELRDLPKHEVRNILNGRIPFEDKCHRVRCTIDITSETA